MAALLSDEINATGECSAVSGWELSRQLPSYTIDLIHYVRELYPMAEITLLVGEDSYMDLPRWKSYEDIVMLCRIVVFRRKPGEGRLKEESDLASEGSVRFIDFDMPISASDIRQRFSKGLEVSRLLPSPIRNYIAEHNLYP
jgi:nicotinate-nucleotide adenylyltransferase